MKSDAKNGKENVASSPCPTIKQDFTVFEQTYGVWPRTETPGKLLKKIRKVFTDAMKRHRV
ncbi:MAG TPA: hypothetical protein PLI09_12240 [Candidatus Hydrogenedentes bacterium]|nr:hypothetical protein [Candidatus Hydrogenedentota bacterium]